MYTAYPLAATVMTLSALEDRFLIASLFHAIFRICAASRGPSASAELLIVVFIGDMSP